MATTGRLRLRGGLSSPATCTGSSGNLSINPNGSTVLLGNVTISGGANLTLVGGTPSTFNINSLTITGNSNIGITSGSVVMNIAGKMQREGHAVKVRHVAEVLAGMTDEPPIGAAGAGAKR